MPKNIKPESYELTLQPFIGPEEIYGDKAFTFEGKIDMTLICEEPTNTIHFHADELSLYFNKVELTSQDDLGISFSQNLEFDSEMLYFTIKLYRKCKEKSKYILTVPFSGKISKNLLGFYQSSYDYDGNTY